MPAPSLLELRAPVNGILVPLEAVPDPVFAGRMTGDGVAIEPLGAEFVAPCDARVMHVHRAGHAITLAAGGVELLLHVGLDTVQLAGEGFTPLVRAGDLVTVGTPLIRIDADTVARRARSLVTPLLVTNMEVVSHLERCTGRVVASHDVVMRISMASVTERDITAGADSSPVISKASSARAAFRIVARSGLHARPAATLAAAAREHTAELRLEKRERVASVRSVVAMLSLEVDYGDVVTLVATGHDARAALHAVTETLLAGLAEEVSEDARTESISVQETLVAPAFGSELRGISAAPGSIAGVVSVHRFHEDVDQSLIAVGSADEERLRLKNAIDRAHHDLDVVRQSVALHDAQHAEIFSAHQVLLADPELRVGADARIANGMTATAAWRDTCADAAQTLEALRNPLLSARATDLRDVCRRVLSVMEVHERTSERWPTGTVLIAEELTPSEIVSLDRERVVGVVMTSGSATSHAAILARGLSLPLIVGAPKNVLAIADRTSVWLDADDGVLYVDPDVGMLERLHQGAERTALRHARELAAAQQPATTRDGHTILVTANIGGVTDAEQCVPSGADGVGLLRSEFAFLHRRTAPDEDTQTLLYKSAAEALATEHTLVIRTLDVGGDKPLPFLPVAPEANPFLGLRGIRLTLEHPELFRTQIRAILRASGSHHIAIMFPMISSLHEWRVAREMVEEERAALQLPPLPIGIMVETAAAALLAETFARDADFFSIGTNDLTQYTLGIDRGHALLARDVDPLHPAVLQLIAHTVRGAGTHHRSVSVCGTLAAHTHAIPVLVGLGVDKLSVDTPLVPAVKWRVRSLDLEECRETAQLALTMGSGDAIRRLVVERHPMNDSAAVVQATI